ncbi:hypothetical protein Fmac_029681 [Flemingia macrophylla]|uniref:Uncharacterized protein n=1 Tax=Flemingia macrophylla TaxID=520843 RepID=A0ABD1LB06_9FABA
MILPFNSKKVLQEDEEDSDEEMWMVAQQSIISQREWKDKLQFIQQTRGSNNIFELYGSFRASVSHASREKDTIFQLRYTNVNFVRSKSMKQPKISGGLMKTLKKNLREAVNKNKERKKEDKNRIKEIYQKIYLDGYIFSAYYEKGKIDTNSIGSTFNSNELLPLKMP